MCIRDRELPIDPINAYNHMAIYLRWCMEHDLMSEDFLKEYSEVAKQVKADPASVDLREFIRDELDLSLIHILYRKPLPIPNGLSASAAGPQPPMRVRPSGSLPPICRNAHVVRKSGI